VKIRVRGIVQGVGFRPFIFRVAVENHLTGYVRNRGDAGVEILLEGKENSISTFLRELKEKKSNLTQIYEVITENLKGRNRHETFKIHKSSMESDLYGSVVPPDIAICNNCLKELQDPEDPRYNYFFITCTDCGPRYTIIKKIPYDRETTTMFGFMMCGFCKAEYLDPLNRRFHAQTVACPKCGPKVYLTDRKGELTGDKDPIREAGRLLSNGFIVAVKGYGGFHVASSAVMDDTRPIVLLRKSEDHCLSNLISPCLHNVGVMLPYTGLHYLLFDEVDDLAFVMTSANPPNQPIIRDNEEALKELGEVVDYFLFHNRQIARRCDDSVIRVHGKGQVFIRRSRGYAPAPIVLKEKSERCIVGLGGELNNTSCVLLEDKAFISQHIGDLENVETREFLDNATKHLIRLTNSRPEAVACDLHPKFITTQYGRTLAEENGCDLVQVQHHYAHVAALMAEHHVNEVVGICCDGYGYGLKGEAWGGEILLCNQGSAGFERVAHLQNQPLAGGDLATRYPLRVAAGILHNRVEVEGWLLKNEGLFPHGESEIRVILNQLEKDSRIIETSSCGRILDAVAAVLGICYERTYEGEPAMKLEALAKEGRDALGIAPIIQGNILDTTQMLSDVFDNRDRIPNADLSRSAHMYLANGLASLAIEKAYEKGVRTVGFSGGVACNEIITLKIREIVESSGLRFLVHKNVPPGDGGTSFGQAVVAGFQAFKP
jgi:hydrogenase maturation protein HypF